jgi:hypothetical protein
MHWFGGSHDGSFGGAGVGAGVFILPPLVFRSQQPSTDDGSNPPRGGHREAASFCCVFGSASTNTVLV